MTRRHTRRDVLQGIASLSGAQFIAPTIGATPQAPVQLLDPQELQKRATPALQQKTIGGKVVQYFDGGIQTNPVILYFHGWGGGIQGAWPREYPLVDSGFRLIIPNRPGYGTTSMQHGRTATDAAHMARALLRELGIQQVAVIGTSGGGPAALTFARLFVGETKALVLQCAVSHRWSEQKYVTKVYRTNFAAANLNNDAGRRDFYRRMNAGVDLQELLRDTFGVDLEEARKRDAAVNFIYGQVVAGVGRDPQGRENDVVNIFLDGQPYFGRGDVRCPTLLVHDAHDQFVAEDHPTHAADYIRGTQRVSVTAGHMIWLGSDARRMHSERVAFLRSHLPRA